MSAKTCCKCGETKPLAAFYAQRTSCDGRYSYCKPCCQAIDRARNTDERREKIRLARQRWRSLNLDIARSRARIYERRRRRTDPFYRIRQAISRSISFRIGNGKKGWRRSEQLLGYTIKQLCEHLEKKFSQDMTWDNYGTHWQIDHIKAVALFRLDACKDLAAAIRECWALSNLQPLRTIDNKKKDAKLNRRITPPSTWHSSKRG
jgi:hypothetical protein